MIHRDSGSGGKDPYGAPTMFNLTNKQPVFVPYGNSALHTDPSYHLPAFYEIWALELENDWKNNQLSGIWSSLAELKTDYEFYRAAAAASRTFFPTTTHATTGLGPDYAEFSGAPTGGNHADFRFDAWRIALNIGMDYAWWAADSWQKTFADRIQAFFVGKGVASYGNQWTLSGNQLGANHSPGLVGCNAVASLAATHENAWKFIDDFWNISMTTGTYRYYDGCLYMMSMLHLSGNFKAYLSTNNTPVPSSSISPTTAVFDKKTDQQADISVTMTLNGNTFTNIKNGGTTLNSGTDYTVSGNTVTIKKEYLATQAVGTTTLTFTFSAGTAQNLVITVNDTTGGDTGGESNGASGTSYNFATDTIPDGYPKYSGTGLTASINGGVLVVTKTTGYSSPRFILPFDVGTAGLSSYSTIEIVVRPVSGDLNGGKTWYVRAGTTSTSFGSVSTNFSTPPLANPTKITINLSGTAGYSGEVELGFEVNNTNPFVYEITSIELKP